MCACVGVGVGVDVDVGVLINILRPKLIRTYLTQLSVSIEQVIAKQGNTRYQ